MTHSVENGSPDRLPCRHDAASGIDMVDLNDPAKVWRCDHCGVTWRNDEPTPEPVQIFAEGSFTEGTLTWGWQCFRCREEETGFGNATTAGEGRDNHQCFIPHRDQS